MCLPGGSWSHGGDAATDQRCHLWQKDRLASPPLPDSSLCQIYPDSSGLGDLGQTDPVGARNRGKTREGSKEGNDQQRRLKDMGDIKVSKYWLLPIV